MATDSTSADTQPVTGSSEAPGATPTPPAGGETPPQQTDLSTLPQDVQDLIKRTRDEAANNRRRVQALEEVEAERKRAEMSEVDRARADTQAQEARANKAELELARYQVASTKGVPGNAVKFLQGSTVAELEASADDLLAMLGNGNGGATPPRQPDFGAGARPSAPAPADFNAVLRRAAGR